MTSIGISSTPLVPVVARVNLLFISYSFSFISFRIVTTQTNHCGISRSYSLFFYWWNPKIVKNKKKYQFQCYFDTLTTKRLTSTPLFWTLQVTLRASKTVGKFEIIVGTVSPSSLDWSKESIKQHKAKLVHLTEKKRRKISRFIYHYFFTS